MIPTRKFTFNKEAILAKSDGEITEMMQNVVLEGWFITSAVHSKWLRDAAEGNIELVREAADFLDFILQYRQVRGSHTGRQPAAGGNRMMSREDIRQLMYLMSARFYDEKVLDVFKGWSRTMQYHFTDIDQYWYIRVVDGKPENPAEGKMENAEVLYEMSIETFSSIANRETTGMKAYMQGKVKVRASMADLMKLKKLD